jgi:mannose-6-phosphate isomerase class I
MVFISDNDSFSSLLVTEGSGKIMYNGGELSFSKGDSIFIPAIDTEYRINGHCEIIVSKVN